MFTLLTFALFCTKITKVPIVISVPFSLQLLKITSIYWVQLKKQQILETPTILIASFKQVMTNLCVLFVTRLRKGEVCNKCLPVSPLWKLFAQRKIAKNPSMLILRIIAYLSKQELLLLIIILSFPFNPSMGNRLLTVKQILEADMCEIVDLKVKIITKSQGKPSVMKNQVSMQKIDRYYCSWWHWYHQTNFMGTTDRLSSFRTVLSHQQSYYLYLW